MEVVIVRAGAVMVDSITAKESQAESIGAPKTPNMESSP
jgi:hypothetical protein